MKLIHLVTVVALAAGQYHQPEFLRRPMVPQNFVQAPQQFANPNFRPMFQRLLPYPQAYYQVPQNHYYPVHVQVPQQVAQVPRQVLNEQDEPEQVDEEYQTEQVLAQIHDWQVLNEQVEDITELEICLSKYNYIYKYF